MTIIRDLDGNLKEIIRDDQTRIFVKCNGAEYEVRRVVDTSRSSNTLKGYFGGKPVYLSQGDIDLGGTIYFIPNQDLFPDMHSVFETWNGYSFSFQIFVNDIVMYDNCRMVEFHVPQRAYRGVYVADFKSTHCPLWKPCPELSRTYEVKDLITGIQIDRKATHGDKS